MKKKTKSFPVKPTLLLAASAVLLLASTVGSTRAALTYYSENYTAQMNMSSIGVTLRENGTAVSSRDYTNEGTWDGTVNGTLLDNMLAEGEKIVPGKPYDEVIDVQNTGNIATFNRVIITKSWQLNGEKNTELTPGLIDLQLDAAAEANGWVRDDASSTEERDVYYLTNALEAGTVSEPLTSTIRIDNDIANSVTKTQNGNVITYVYDYNGYTFNVEAEVDAVQTHNAAEAIRSSWGVDVNVSADETSFSLQ